VFEVMSLAGWVVAYFAASPLAPVVERLMPAGWTSQFGPAVLHIVTLAIAFFSVLIVWSLVSRLVKMLIHATPLSVLDRLGGAGFGALRGIFIALLLVLVVGASPLAQSSTWQASLAAPMLSGVLRDAAPLMPEPIARFISRSMTPSAADSTD
ncbi:MAG TPA: CvpA family protein, partial [Roseateles sp.]|nr:CvpA family protein [Roseateles sp.]